MAVVDPDDLEINITIGLSFYTPTTAMSKILQLKNKSRKGSEMLRALRTVHADMLDSRDVLSCDAKIPSGDAMLNQCLAIAEWSTETERDFTTAPLRGIVLLNLAAEPTRVSCEVLEGRKRKALRQK